MAALMLRFLVVACPVLTASVDDVDWLARANTIARTLLPEFPESKELGLFDASTALWRTSNGSGDQLGWQNGYTLKTLSNFAACARRKGAFPETVSAVTAALDRTFSALAWNAGRVAGDNKYDDLNFWTSTWRVAYAYTGNTTYAKAATNLLYNYVLKDSSWLVDSAAPDAIWRGTGPGVPCLGGALWDKDAGYINAISNQWLLYNLADAGSLDGVVARSDARAWAAEVWDWVASSPMINDQHLFNDGLNPMPAVAGVACANNEQQVWTYNQGVVLGGLAELAATAETFEKRQELLNAGIVIARAAATTLVAKSTVNGNATVDVLDETACAKAEDCRGNNEVFKGMFVQHLAHLVSVVEDGTGPTADTEFFRRFVRDNAASLWQHANSNAGSAKPPFFGFLWQGPAPADQGSFYQTTATQSIALDATTTSACL